jgi:hypothetical protein
LVELGASGVDPHSTSLRHAAHAEKEAIEIMAHQSGASLNRSTAAHPMSARQRFSSVIYHNSRVR